jgi:hypothetical protein
MATSSGCGGLLRGENFRTTDLVSEDLKEESELLAHFSRYADHSTESTWLGEQA